MTTTTTVRKALRRVYNSPSRHWVGDGFPVRTVLSHREFGAEISPFLMLDYIGPVEVAPSDAPRGVGEHPHRGFETVTIVYQGEVAHRDSTGNAGVIGPGDVQWMTAASGIVHEEMYSTEFARRGGTLHAAQLWVNLPARDKMAPPGYQTLVEASIPVVPLPEGAGSLRVIAGEYAGTRGPARTFTPVNVWDVRLAAGSRATLPVPDGYTTTLVVMTGEVTLNETERLAEAELALFEREGEEVVISTAEEATVLVLSGAPIDEPVAAYGPFVMNTQQEIGRALHDYQAGRLGHLS